MCPSKGTMDIFVEAILPRPELVIFGASPVAIALAALAKPMGFTTTICAEPNEHDKFHFADKFVDGLNYETNTSNKRYVIVSTQGRGDQVSLENALSLNAEFVAFVGSRKKAEKLKGNLADTGMSHDQLNTIKAPAGLDINAITPEEIALSILAELTQFRRADQYQSFRSDHS
jgi:xanthine dehydrogenase accessory factor